jgi:hypothetical protein
MSDVRGVNPFPVPYEAIAHLMKQRTITLFLGAAASRNATPSSLPDGRQLTKRLMELANYPGKDSDPLTKVSQYLVECAVDRNFVLEFLKTHFHEQISAEYCCSVTEFLSKIPACYMPELIVTTNYDTLIERLLEHQSVPYLCISHILGHSKYTGRLIVYEKLGAFSRNNILTRTEAEEILEDRSFAGAKPIILYKMHGSAISYVPRNEPDKSLAGGLNSIVVTEQDYIDFLDKATKNQLPIQVQEMLRRSQFLFLGYSLVDWNFRLLLTGCARARAVRIRNTGPASSMMIRLSPLSGRNAGLMFTTYHLMSSLGSCNGN